MSRRAPVLSSSLVSLMQRLEYQFADPKLLAEALTHRSFGASNNERLEFVGDSILNYTIARMLFDHFPDEPEGSLSRLRANLVNQEMLASLARSLELGTALRLGEGEARSGGHDRPSILADALEAVFAAIAFDHDFMAAEAVIRRLFADHVAQLDPAGHVKDAKTRLQEWLQAHKMPLPQYQIIEQLGEAHAQHFRVACELLVLNVRTEGEGSSRRRAEQQAAEAALQYVDEPFSRR